MNPQFGEIISDIEQFADTSQDIVQLQKIIVDTIAKRLPSYNWVGFYMLDPKDTGTLVLGEFHGAPTEHVHIPVAEGICGAAVAQRATIIVDDVSADPRYLSCSIETQSEIVVPIWAHEKIVGEIDIDSHSIGAFGPEDRDFLEKCAALVGQFMERLANHP